MSCKDEAELLEKMAAEELLKEAERGCARASVAGPSGWKKCPLPKTNKRFLTNTLLNVVNANSIKNYKEPKKFCDRFDKKAQDHKSVSSAKCKRCGPQQRRLCRHTKPALPMNAAEPSSSSNRSASTDLATLAKHPGKRTNTGVTPPTLKPRRANILDRPNSSHKTAATNTFRHVKEHDPS